MAIIALILIIAKPFGGNKDPQTSATPAPVSSATEQPGATDSQNPADRASALAGLLGNQDADVQGLSADQMAQVSDLSVNQGLPQEWMNILLLGSDEREMNESARTDCMIICSINTQTGEVKLTSIMRDLAVKFSDIGEYNGTYRINAANYFGGERLAMRTVNECFGMNIDKYVRVNFYGFQQIAQMLGGIDIDITEAEMEEINYRVQEQWYEAYLQGIDESALPNELLESYGENTHLDGRQTLAYARIRHMDGGDYARAERQRKVLFELMKKLEGMGIADLAKVGMEAMKHMKTNLSLDEIMNIAQKVLGADLTSIDSFRLPINNSYKQETRNNQDMLYDCDWGSNASSLYTFIYG
ncbi:MAG: LCP family protein [Candidatus Faecivicinus sp.]|nr:LCP family protein [Candidatus Faecivicinus sp.]